MGLKYALGGDPILAGLSSLMDLSAFWKPPELPAGSIATGGVAWQDYSSAAAPSMISTNSGAGHHLISLTSPPAGLVRWIDMSQHFVTEYLAIQSTLAAKYRCGGIVFKASALSPGEIALWDIVGTNASPHALAPGTNGSGNSLITDYNGFDPGMIPPAPQGPCGTAASGSGWYLGYGLAATGWFHWQFATLAAGAATVRSRLSAIGGPWASYFAIISAGGNNYVDSGAACAADGISNAFQIGLGGSHDTGVFGVACAYVGTDDALPNANLQAIHELFVN